MRHKMRHNWKRKLTGVVVLLLLGAIVAVGQTPERWLHVRVEKTGDNAETVRVNVPLALAEKILPAVNIDRIRNGRITIEGTKAEGVDLRALFEAVKTTQDGEFVTVESKDENVRVAKAGGYLLVKVRDERTRKGETRKEEVDVKIPMTVVEAALSGGRDELDLLAAIKALSAHGDSELVTVRGHNETVRVWIDTKNTQ